MYVYICVSDKISATLDRANLCYILDTIYCDDMCKVLTVAFYSIALNYSTCLHPYL